MRRQRTTDNHAANGLSIRISEPAPASPKELARRRKLVEKTLKLRDEIGPVDFSIAEVVRAMREGEANGRG